MTQDRPPRPILNGVSDPRSTLVTVLPAAKEQRARWLVVAAADRGIEAALRAQGFEDVVVRIDGPGAVLDGLLRGRDWDGAIIALDGGAPDGASGPALAAVRHGARDLPALVVLDDEVDPASVARWRARGASDVIGTLELDQLRARVEALRRPRTPPLAAPEPTDVADAGRLLAAITQAGTDIAHAETFDEALTALVVALDRTTNVDAVETWHLADDRVRLVAGPWAGAPELSDLRSDPTALGLIPRAGLVRYVFEHAVGATVPDLREGDQAEPNPGPGETPRFVRRDAALALDVRAVHATPLVADDQVLAVVVVLLRDPTDLPAAMSRCAWWCAWAGATLSTWLRWRTVTHDRGRLHEMIDESPVGFVACDEDGRLTVVNRTMERAGLVARAGEDRERWTGAWNLVGGDGVTPVPAGEDPLSRALRGEVVADELVVATPAGGSRRHWRVDATPVGGSAPDGAVATFRPMRAVRSRSAPPGPPITTSELVLRDFRLLLDRAADLAAAVGDALDLRDVWRALDAFLRATTPATRWRVERAGGAAMADGGPDPQVPTPADADLPPDRRVTATLRVSDRELGRLTLLAQEPGAFDERHTTAATMAANLVAVAVDHADLVVQERELRARAEASAHHFRSMFHATPLAVSLTSLDDDVVLDVNPAFAALLGHTRDALVGQPVDVLQHWVDADVRAALKAAVVAGRGVKNQEVGLRRKDGSERRCLVSAERTEHHGRPAMLFTVVDVTERLAQETELRQLATFREKLMGFVEQTLDEGFEGGAFFQRLVESAVAATPGAEAGSLLLRDDEGDVYRFVAAVGFDLEGLRSVTFTDAEVYRSVESGRPVVVHRHPESRPEDVRSELLQRYGRAADIQATLIVPILLSGRRVATLDLDSFSSPDAFGEDALRLASAFAAQAATLVKRRALEVALERMAYHDHLTGLPNRLLFRDRLVQAIAHARRTGRRGAALFVDVDNLKVTNDTLGHSVGDALLRGVAERLQRAVREVDTVARIGGDEFTVVLPEVADAAAAGLVADKLLAAFREPFAVEGHEVHSTASVGVTLFPDDAVDADALIQHGDTAMYQAKNQGKDRYRFFTRDMNRALMERVSLEAQIRKALERDEFSLHFQPRVSLADGRITSVEALARWQHPERGWIAPADFIHVAEEAGLIGTLGRHLLTLACAQGRQWAEAGTPVVVAVNLSAKQLQERDVVAQIEAVLDETGYEASGLEIELTESAVMRNIEENVGKLAALRALGIQVSIDDFGTGYSSLSYLKRLPATALKIDRSFVADLGRDGAQAPHDAGIVRAVVALSSTLGLMAIAEGIETTAQLDFLRGVGCEQGQGFLLSRPAAAQVVTPLLAAGRVPMPFTPSDRSEVA